VKMLVSTYSPECVEGLFCELRRDGVLRSSRRILVSGIIQGGCSGMGKTR
jgi:hypothetical protein